MLYILSRSIYKSNLVVYLLSIRVLFLFLCFGSMWKFPELHNFNEMYTPDSAIEIISNYIPPQQVLWEACYWLWHFAKWLTERWRSVVWEKDIDCLVDEPKEKRDILITNPPFNWNKKFIKRAIELWKPFIFLLRLEHLWWVQASELLWNLQDISVIIPKKRINYITPKMMRWEKVWWSQFHSVFLCYWLNLGKQIIYH